MSRNSCGDNQIHGFFSIAKPFKVKVKRLSQNDIENYSKVKSCLVRVKRLSKNEIEDLKKPKAELEKLTDFIHGLIGTIVTDSVEIVEGDNPDIDMFNIKISRGGIDTILPGDFEKGT